MSAEYVLLFPGQGSQQVGMGRRLAQQERTARRVFDEADAALGFALSSLCWDGPQEQLLRTEFAQPAILTHSIAALRVAQERGGWRPTAAAGHSLGEWTALVAAGSLTLTQAVRLVHLRGQFMQTAVPLGAGAMTAVLGLALEHVEAACRGAAQGEVVVAATHNDAAHVVISGHAAAVARAEALCAERGALKCVPLPVSAPFHSPLMAPAAERLAEALAGVSFLAPEFPIRSTIVERFLDEPGRFADLLVLQMTAPVLWQEAIAALAAAGPGGALAFGPAAAVPGLVKRTARGLRVRVLGEPEDFEAGFGAPTDAPV